MRIEELTIDHLRRLKVRELERLDMGDNWIEDHGKLYLESHFKKALVNDSGEVIFCIGGKVFKEFAQVWLVGSELIYKTPISSMKHIMKVINEAPKMFNLKLIYTYNDPGIPEACKFLERVGFKEHGKWNHFKDGKERLVFTKEVF